LVQGQGGGEFQPAGILKYVEDLKREPNADIEPKDIFEIASIIHGRKYITGGWAVNVYDGVSASLPINPHNET